MFHRVRSEAPQPAAKQPQERQQNQQPNMLAPESEANPAADIKTGDMKNAQTPASEQNRTAAPQIQHQNPAATPSPTSNANPSSKQEDAQHMTNQTPNTPNTQANEDYAAPRALDTPVSPYQRPGQAPVRAGGQGYPGAYPAAVYPGRKDSTAAAPATSDRRLTVGRGISISGEIESCDHLTVEGTVEAALKGASVLEIAESGTFYGTVDIDEATIAGRFEGDITVRGRLTIRTTGTITGSITYKELEVESGAVIDGRMTPAGATGEARSKSGKSARKESKASQKDQSESENDGGLFNTKAAAE